MTAPASFSTQLRSATWPSHQRAESTAYLDALMRGEVDRLGYAAMAAQHYFAYVVLEDAARTMHEDLVAGPFADPALDRVPALIADLTALLGSRWAELIEPNPGTQRYCERMREVCFTWPGGFVAHHYTRYLGDLSGGQFLRRGIESRLGLTPSTGTQFYDFDSLGDLGAFKDAYRARLDAVPWSEDERARVIAEATLAYDLNTEVLVDLAATH